MGANKFLYAGFGVAVLVAGVYFFFLRPEAEETGPALSTSSGGQALSDSAQADREFIVLLQQLQAINLDPSLFADPVFDSLQDFRIEPAPQPIGRVNPFAPSGR